MGVLQSEKEAGKVVPRLPQVIVWKNMTQQPYLSYDLNSNLFIDGWNWYVLGNFRDERDRVSEIGSLRDCKFEIVVL